MSSNHKMYINSNESSLGIELGSTRVKAVLIGPHGEVLATGYSDWENQLVDGVWTYSLEDVWTNIQAAYKQVKETVQSKYDLKLKKIGNIGVSAMMHGYLVFNDKDEQLAEFRTWRNAMTAEAEEKLTDLLQHNIPQRWSSAHLFQAVLNKEEHIDDIFFITTLSGYVHWKLTGMKVLGIGDASGMFPIDSEINNYNELMINRFNDETKKHGFNKKVEDILPTVLLAGEDAGSLSDSGRALLDPDEDLEVGISLVPPEGDAGTGMVATNAIKEGTGNISAGTSVFAMIVLKNALSKVYPEIDIVTTPTGSQVAMVHVNNCTTEINSWVNIFKDFVKLMDLDISDDRLFEALFKTALNSDSGMEGILSYGYHSGENITKVDEGRPLLVRQPDANFNLSNLMRTILDGAFATLNIGLEILNDEGVNIESIVGHGGIFKTKNVADRIVANAVGSPVSLMETANEGGAWGMALLASYKNYSTEMSLDEYLDTIVFKEAKITTYIPKDEDIKNYKDYVERYKNGIELEQLSSKLV